MTAFTPVVEIGALSGGILYDRFYAGGIVKGHVDRLGYKVEAVVGRDEIEVAARMKVKHG